MKRILLLILLLVGCQKKIDMGVVIDKIYEPERTYTSMMPVVVSTGKSVMTVMIPYRVTDNEDFIIIVNGITDEFESVNNKYYISKKLYKRLEIGKRVYINNNNDVSEIDYNNSKERVND